MLEKFINCRDVERAALEWKLLVLHALVSPRMHDEYHLGWARDVAQKIINGHTVTQELVVDGVKQYSIILKNYPTHANWPIEFRQLLLQRIDELTVLRGKIIKQMQKMGPMPFETAKVIMETLYLLPNGYAQIDYLSVEYRYILYILLTPDRAIYRRNRLLEWIKKPTPEQDTQGIEWIETLINLQAMLIIKLHKPVMSVLTEPLFKEYRVTNKLSARRHLLKIICAVPEFADEAMELVEQWEAFKQGREKNIKKVLNRIIDKDTDKEPEHSNDETK